MQATDIVGMYCICTLVGGTNVCVCLPQEVQYYLKMGVENFRNDPILADACRADVDKYCPKTQPGGWERIHTDGAHLACQLVKSDANIVSLKTALLLHAWRAVSLAHVCLLFAGHGRINRCLRGHIQELTPACRAEQQRLIQCVSCPGVVADVSTGAELVSPAATDAAVPCSACSTPQWSGLLASIDQLSSACALMQGDIR